MKPFLIIFLAIGAVRCQQQCASKDDIAKIIETPPKNQTDLETLLSATDRQTAILNKHLSQYKPDEYPKDAIPIQCSAAIIGNLFTDIDPYVNDEKWEISESTLKQYESLEKSMNEGTNSRVKRGFLGFIKKVVNGIVKIAQQIAQVLIVVKKIVAFVNTVISLVKDIRNMFRSFG